MSDYFSFTQKDALDKFKEELHYPTIPLFPKERTPTPRKKRGDRLWIMKCGQNYTYKPKTILLDNNLPWFKKTTNIQTLPYSRKRDL